MTRVEFLRKRYAELLKRINKLGIDVLAAAYEDPRKYWMECGKYRAYQGQADAIRAEIEKTQSGDDGALEESPALNDNDDEDEPPRPQGVRRRPRNWGGGA